MVVIDGITLKGRCVVMPDALKKQALDQLHLNHMGIGARHHVAYGTAERICFCSSLKV